MKKLIIALTILLMGAASLAVAVEKPGKSDAPTSFARAKRLAAKQNKPLLLDFMAVW